MEGLILSRISAEFLIVLGFSLLSAQFMTGAFCLGCYQINDLNSGREINAHKSDRFKKINNTRKFLPIMKLLITPPEKVVSVITQV